ncbi:MAG: iron-containing alcohol dehydrogenase, partial [Thermoproteota archaeon]
MNGFTFHLPTKVIFGRGSMSKLGEEAARLGKRCLVVTGRNFARKSGYLDAIGASLAKSGLEFSVFDQVEPHPSIGTVYK